MLIENTEIYFSRNQLKIYSGHIFMGKLHLFDLDKPGAFISTFEIKEKFRNQGHGNHLLTTAINLAKKNNCESVSLFVNADNHKAIKLYKKFGFFTGYKTDNTNCFVMVKKLRD